MPVDVVVKGYKFEELNEKAKDRVRGWYAEHWLAHSWWDFLFDDLIEDMAEKGINIPDNNAISFSGFCSPGDGASFTASIDVKKFVSHPDHKLEADYPEICTRILNGEDVISLGIERTGRAYAHEQTVSMLAEWDASDEVVERLHDALEAFAGGVMEICRDYMRAFYRKLEEQYGYECSDEAMAETFHANEVLFDNDGDTL